MSIKERLEDVFKRDDDDLSDEEIEDNDSDVVDQRAHRQKMDPYENRSKEIPKYEKLLEEAKSFSNAHRFILQQMIVQPMISLKKFYVMFIDYVVTVTLRRHNCVIKYVNADAEQLRKLAITVIRTFNEEAHDKKLDQKDEEDDAAVIKHAVEAASEARQKEKEAEQSKGRKKGATSVLHQEPLSEVHMIRDIGLRLVLTSDEETGKDFVVLASQVQNSEALKSDHGMTAGELNLWWLIVDEMVHNYGQAEREWIMRVASKVNNSLTMLKTEKFLYEMVKRKWVTMTDDHVKMSSRAVAELDPFLRKKYINLLKVCRVCNQLIICMQYSAECKSCEIFFHYNCFKRAAHITQSDGMECSNCNVKILSEDVAKAVKEAVREVRMRDPEHVPLPTKTAKDEVKEEEKKKEKKKAKKRQLYEESSEDDEGEDAESKPKVRVVVDDDDE